MQRRSRRCLAVAALCTGVLLIGSCADRSQPPHEASVPDSKFEMPPDTTASIPWSSEPESTDSSYRPDLIDYYYCITGTRTDSFSGIYHCFSHSRFAYVKDWDRFYTMPEEVRIKEWIEFPGPITEDTAMLLFAVDLPNGKIQGIQTVTLKRDSNEVDVQTFDLGRIIETDRIFGGFVDELHGNLFFFRELTEAGVPAWEMFLLKTDDGGNTWYEQPCDPVLQAAPRECPEIARFVTPDIGIVGYRYAGDEDFCKRTYLTRDGGKTWDLIPKLQYPYWERSGTEVIQFQLIDGTFLLDVYHHAGERQYCSRWSSTDLAHWSFQGYSDSGDDDNTIIFAK